MEFIFIVFVRIVLALIFAAVGDKRNIGGTAAFFAVLLLGFIGMIIVWCSKRKETEFDSVSDWEQPPMPPINPPTLPTLIDTSEENKDGQQSTNDDVPIYVNGQGWVTTGTDFQDPTPPQPLIEPKDIGNEEEENTEPEPSDPPFMTTAEAILCGFIGIMLIVLILFIVLSK